MSVGEARALDQAAAMLEQQRLAPGAAAGATSALKRTAPSPAPAASPSA